MYRGNSVSRSDILALLFHSTPIYAGVVEEQDAVYDTSDSFGDAFYTAYERGRQIAETVNGGLPAQADGEYFPGIDRARTVVDNQDTFHAKDLPWAGLRNTWCLALQGIGDGTETLFPELRDEVTPLLEGGGMNGDMLDEGLSDRDAKADVARYTWDVVKPFGDVLRYGHRLDEMEKPASASAPRTR